MRGEHQLRPWGGDAASKGSSEAHEVRENVTGSGARLRGQLLAQLLGAQEGPWPGGRGIAFPWRSVSSHGDRRESMSRRQLPSCFAEAPGQITDFTPDLQVLAGPCRRSLC